MRNADKIIIGFLIALVIGAGYFQYLADKLNERMDEIKTIDQKLVDVKSTSDLDLSLVSEMLDEQGYTVVQSS